VEGGGWKVEGCRGLGIGGRSGRGLGILGGLGFRVWESIITCSRTGSSCGAGGGGMEATSAPDDLRASLVPPAAS
jgi:hypothetical protein